MNQQMPRTHAGRCVLFCTAKKFHVVSKMSSTLGLNIKKFCFCKDKRGWYNRRRRRRMVGKTQKRRFGYVQ